MNLETRMNQLRDFAASDAPVTTTVTPLAGYSKDGKTIDPVMSESRVIQRWGVWADAGGYFNGRSIGTGSIGVDYRVKPHWLIGAYGSYWYSHRSFFSGGLYTAFYEHQWWGVLGGQLGVNDYTAYASSGYDFAIGHWLIGPVLSFQFDSVPVDQGFGRGNLFQTRAGGRLAYNAGRLRPELQVMYEDQAINNDSQRGSSLWLGLGLSYLISDSWSVYGAYSFEGNSSYQINQVNLGIRKQF